MRRQKHHVAGRRARIPITAPFTVTSMLDMFTIILVFLLNFLDPANESHAELELPAIKADQAVQESVVLTVTKDRVLVNGKEVLGLSDGQLPAGVARSGRVIDALHERLALAAESAAVSRTQGEQEAENPVLAVQCDRAVPFSVLGELLYTAGQAGFGQYRFVVINDAG